MKTKLFIIFYSAFMLASCQKDCSAIKVNFQSFNEAVKTIKNTDFSVEEELSNSNSSWIVNAEYYSCDNNFGYMILYTDSNEYIFQDMPINVWGEFQKADSKGRFYNRYIKSRYPIKLAK